MPPSCPRHAWGQVGAAVGAGEALGRRSPWGGQGEGAPEVTGQAGAAVRACDALGRLGRLSPWVDPIWRCRQESTVRGCPG